MLAKNNLKAINFIFKLSILFYLCLVNQSAFGLDNPNIGARATSMGGNYRSIANDWSAMYWNPAGLAFLESSEARFIYHPWIVNTGLYFAGAGIVLPGIGNLGISFSHFDFGEEEGT